MHRVKARVESNAKVVHGVHRLRLSSSEIALEAEPGQFVHVLCGENRDYILRRPFSVHRVQNGSFDLLIQVVGKGTTYLSQLESGDALDIMGPIGRGFEFTGNFEKSLLVAGGIGVAPLVFLAERLREDGKETHFLYGAATREGLVCLEDLSTVVQKVFSVTEDGSFGYEGLLTEFFGEAFQEYNPDRIFACGPEEMLRKVAESTAGTVPCQVSLERKMACGIGACLSCVCRTREGYRRVCVDGPVFDASEIIW
ncbi:MAG: dihydroorotate dehydrogenase electron transfer subunit [Actinomycetota bacterium]|nr:dihydroorotate dehydrogenase electron transfer subunit [Actinomycetota bacterium]